MAISIHAPPRGATLRHIAAENALFISIHAPPRGATYRAYRMTSSRSISIHAPPRGATHPAARRTRRSMYFNSRPSARGDAKRCYMANMAWIFQFTPLREGRPDFAKSDYRTYISIHAPPRGATNATRRGFLTPVLFQFTPLREGRPHFPSRTITRGVFQFTPLREGRRLVAINFAKPRRISIHAPPRGATRMKCASCKPTLFQFTPLREGRHACRRHCVLRYHYFNSRPSARGDAKVWRQSCCLIEFQFTPLREGRHRSEHVTRFGRSISIHAPPRGATVRVLVAAIIGAISIHAPPRGATGRTRGFCHRQHFNSRPSARGDGSKMLLKIGIFISIHAPPRGATIRGFRKRRTPCDFNSRPSARGDRRDTSDRATRAFQFTPLREGRRLAGCMGSRLMQFQFTPLREGRRLPP